MENCMHYENNECSTSVATEEDMITSLQKLTMRVGMEIGRVQESGTSISWPSRRKKARKLFMGEIVSSSRSDPEDMKIVRWSRNPSEIYHFYATTAFDKHTTTTLVMQIFFVSTWKNDKLGQILCRWEYEVGGERVTYMLERWRPKNLH